MILLAVSGTGVIEGGWEYIWAAYLATWLFFGGYAMSLYVRSP